MPKKDFRNIGSYRKNQGASGGALRAEPPQPIAAQGGEDELVSLIPLERILPDPYQSRAGLLPPALMMPVYNGELSPGDALEQWIESLDDEPHYRARYDELVELADSIRQWGMINPIHIYHPPRQVERYRVESGERRFWAHWLLSREDPERYASIRAIVETGFSIYRQVDENEDVAGLSPVGEARNTARLFLTELKITPPAAERVDEQSLYRFYRQVTLPASELIGQEYLPDGFWARLAELTRKSRDTLKERLDVFLLPPQALEVADAARLNLLQISEILRAERDEVRTELTALAAERRLAGAALRRLARLSVDNEAAYRHEVAVIRGQEKREKRRQGTPLEVHTRRLAQAVRGFDRLNEQEYRAVAERLAGADPGGVAQITANLEKLLVALRECQGQEY